MKQQTVILEPSTNTHSINGIIEVVDKTEQLNGIVLRCKGKAIILHGEHGVIFTESENVIKLTQQELNPLTGLLEIVND
jgi:hypothetical protein